MSDELDRAVAEVVKRQKDAGIDIGNDGEQQRVAFQTYMAARMSGYGGESKRRVGKDFVEHPDWSRPSAALRASRQDFQRAAGDRGREIHRHRARSGRDRALQEIRVAAFAEQFMTAPSPGIVATTLMNAHYDSHEAT
jgi:5-methyltetrahydropteroyltriglutamate--homocysteine methyltransferase